LRLLVDENLAGRELTSRLRRSKHQLVELSLGAPDEEVWRAAQAEGATILTLNAKDFIRLAAATRGHSGPLLVFRDNDRLRDMTAMDIAVAVDRFEEAHPEGLVGQTVVLNTYRL
jgi:predicted nuclease of predicted toxin-antitoxin system